MENRFGFKDFLVVLLLVAIVVTMGLKMLQDDRQWDKFALLQRSIDEQTKDMTALRRLIGQGGVSVAPANGGSPAPAPVGDVFRRARAVKQRADYAPGDWVVDTFASAPPKLNFLTGQDVYGRVVYSRVLEGLVGTDIETLEDVPHIARSWRMSEDGLSLDVELRTDVNFSDGEPMDADDVVYTWKLLKDSEITDGSTREYYRNISEVEKTGDYAVRFRFERVHYENFSRATGVFVLPQHFYERYTPRQIREHPALLMGTGPYKLPDPTKYTPGDTIELVRNERYWGPPGPWDRMIWKIIEKESTELVTFRNGETDMFVPVPEQHVSMLEDKELVDRSQFVVYEHIRAGYGYVAWNQKRSGKPTHFTDKRVRQAMTMIINRQGLLDEVFLGFGRVANGPFSHLGEQSDPQVQTWPYDPERAVALLAEAGFKRAADGTMLMPDGRPFEIQLTYPSGTDIYQKMSLYIKDNFAKVGVNLKLDPQKWALLLKSLNERTFDAIMLGWGAGGLESDIEQMFHTRTIEGDGDNRNAYSSPELDALIDKAHVTLDEEERMKIWRRCHAILHEDQPYTFMLRLSIRLWLDDRFANVEPIDVFGVNHVTTWPTPIEWYVPAALQKRGK